MRISKLVALVAAAIALGGPVAPAFSQKQGAQKPAASIPADRFSQGAMYEHRGNHKAALEAYTESAEAGNARAQKKLGDIYGHGNSAVVRDYEASLKWYTKARDQGIEVPSPETFQPSMPGTLRIN